MDSPKKRSSRAPESEPSSPTTSFKAGSTRSISPLSRDSMESGGHVPVRWVKTVSFVSAMIACLSAGSILLMSLYAPIFQEKLHYSNTEVNLVSIAGELGMYLPVPFFGYISDRIGPAKLSLLSGVLFAPSYALAAYAYNHRLSYPFMVLAFFFVGSGTSSMYFSGVTTCAKNFTGARGLALALPIAAFGLSSLWLAQLLSRVFGSNDGKDLELGSVFTFLSIFLAVVSAIGGLGLKVVPDTDNGEKLLDDEHQVDERDTLVGSSRRSYGTTTQGYATATEGSTIYQSARSVMSDVPEDQDWWINKETRAFLRDPTMWWFAAGFFLVTGPGEAFINNMGVLIQTLYAPDAPPHPTVSPTLHVSIVATTSTIARLVAGTLSDYLAPPTPLPHVPITRLEVPKPKRFTCSRMTLLIAFALIMSLGQVLVASGAIAESGPRFWLVSSTIGCGYGAVFTLAPTAVSVVWGTENFGTNWGIVTVTPALGASVFGMLFASGYDKAAAGQEWDGMCYGPSCYRQSFWAMAGAVWVACGLWMWAWKGKGGWKSRGVVV